MDLYKANWIGEHEIAFRLAIKWERQFPYSRYYMSLKYRQLDLAVQLMALDAAPF
jgi:hypothetical protein